MPNELLTGMASQAGSAGMGLILQGFNDDRQLGQQRRLLEQQYAIDNKMAESNYERQLRMFKDTGYEAQMQQLKAAGLNPALMYKSGGPGGQLGAAGASVHGASAPVGGMEILNAMMTKAQIDNLNAQTQKTKAETVNVPKTGENIDADTMLKNANSTVARIDGQLKQATFEYNKQAAFEAMLQLGHQNDILWKQGLAMGEEGKLAIEQAQQNIYKTIAEIQAQYRGMQLDQAQIDKIAKEVSQMDAKLQNETDMVKIQQQLANWNTSFSAQAIDVVRSLIGILPGMKGGKGGGITINTGGNK